MMLLVVPCPADEGISKTDLHASIWACRQAIATAWFEIERSLVEHGPDGSSLATNASYKIGILGSMMLFEANGDALIGHPGVSGVKDDIESGRLRIQRRRVLYAQTDTQTYLYLDRGAQLQVGLPPDAAKRAVQFFDIRRLGLEVAPGPTAISSGGVEITQAAASSSDPRKVEMNYVCHKDATKTSIVVDPTSFGVSRVEGMSADGRVRTVTEIENAVDTVSGIVFPTRVSIHDYVGGILSTETVLTVKKASLNGPIDERQFLPDQFHMARDTVVVDMPSRRILGVWNGRMFVERPGIEVDSATMNAIYGRATTSQPAH
ncbi:MAG: hypothetical protein HY718_07070 [Planctomycetes bacterium]|nr:hypothetical protein [Planctomycetota bacterium]